jgi:hypothetical protein
MNAPSKDKMRKLLADRPAPILKDGSAKDVDIFCALKFMDEIHSRAETVTPLLKEILDRSGPYWRG